MCKKARNGVRKVLLGQFSWTFSSGFVDILQNELRIGDMRTVTKLHYVSVLSELLVRKVFTVL